MSSSARALPLIAQIYDAALSPSRWQDVVMGLSEAYDGAAIGFAFQLPGFPVQGAFFEHGMRHPDPRYLDVFVEHHRRGLPWAIGYVENFVGRFGLANEVFPDEDVASTDYYREWMQPLGFAACGPMGHTIAIEDGHPVAVIAIFKLAGESPWRPEDCELGDLLVPHFARAYALHQRFSEMSALAEALDRLPTGVMLLDARGQVVVRNRSADRILELSDGLQLESGIPRAMRAADNATLQQMIRGALDATMAGAEVESQVMAVTRPSGRRAFPLMLTPLLSAAPEPTQHDAVAVLYVSDVEDQTLQRSEPLRKLYGLTQAEVELVELLCDGWSLEESAGHRGVTMNTARSQLKQIFFKTGTSRQSELVRLVLAGIAPIRDPRRSRPEKRRARPGGER